MFFSGSGALMPHTPGTHILVELHGCDPARLADVSEVSRLMRETADKAGLHVVDQVMHKFEASGVTAVLLLAESHFSVHTWPEWGYAAADFFTCGAQVPPRAISALTAGCAAEQVEVMTVSRGNGMRVMRVTPGFATVG